jgi:hypothetical protein
MSNYDFNDLLNLLDGEDFEERPVDIEVFVTSEDYLGLGATPLSENQYQLIRASSQIYKRTTLHNLYGFDEGEKRWKQTYNEIIFQLGKGSGKGHVSSIACAYVVYLLLCLKDPQKYYGRPPGDSIDILNIAINATQANNVFFKYFTNRITRSPWFTGKYEQKKGEYAFDKDIYVYSGHSEREAWEGYNVLYVVLDEISGFALDSTSGHEGAKTAQAVYDMYRASVTSRFAEFGKLILLSFPRFKNDFIQQRYNAVIAEKEVIIRSHTFRLDADLPEGTEGNEFTIEWEEDRIISYNTPKVFALKRPSWEVNPTKSLDVDYMRDFYDNPVDALSRFACMPPDAIDAFFKDRQKIERAFASTNGVDEEGRFTPGFLPESDKIYYVHVDLARKHDHCAVSLAHVEKWERRKIGATLTEAAPVVKVDAVRWWTPTKEKNVDFTEVREYIVSLRQRGFNIKLVTFDRWESHEMMEYLKGVGINSERLSVAKKHYEDMALAVQEERIIGPQIQLLRDELLQLRIMPNDKVDHPRKGSKDLADAVCGAIYNAISLTPRERNNDVIEIQTLSSFNKTVDNVQHRTPDRRGQIIQPPKREMPRDLGDFLSGLELI